MKPLKPAFRNAALAVAFVGILVAADIASGVDLLRLPLPSSATDLRRFQEGVERTWEGGGGQILFADDFDRRTAEWLAKEGEGIPGYHGGALPETGSGPTKWAQDLYRWGHAATAVGSADGWNAATDGFLRFGNEEGYPSGVASELVSPVIDLRGVPRLPEDANARLSVNPDPAGRGNMNCPPEPGARILGVDELYLERGGEVGCAYSQAIKDAIDTYFVDGRRTQELPQTAAAALRVRHGYDFYSDLDGLVDGGRVVVAAYDPGTQAWGEWVAITPTDRVLQLGDEQLRVRRGDLNEDVPSVEARGRAVAPSQEDLENGGQPDFAAEIIVDDGVTLATDGTNPPFPTQDRRDLDPHLYQGAIGASGQSPAERWKGFGGQSGGLVDSVFDLSAFAGRLIRLGFQAATAPSDQPILAQAGWVLDAAEVHAAGLPTVQVVGLAKPGNGAALPPNSDVQPSLMLQNTGTDPVVVVVTTSVLANGKATQESQRFRLSVGPLARIHAPTGLALKDIEAGAFAIDVIVHEVASDPPQTDVNAQHPDAVEAHFHFVASDASGWRSGRLSFRPLIFEDGQPTEGLGKLVARNQKANIHLELENTGTVPKTVELGVSASERGHVRPVLVDESGVEHGTMRLVPASSTSITLPVARSVAGSEGTPMAARVATWEWSGGDIARSLRLRILDADGQVLREGGEVMVETVAPNPLDVDFSNLWDFHAGATNCTRFEQWTDAKGAIQRGIIQCPVGDARVTSAARRLFEIDLLRGNATRFILSYQGGPIRATVQVNRSAAPEPVPPANAVWTALGKPVQFNATVGWRTVNLDGPRLPAGFSGHVRFKLEALGGNGFDLDEAGLYLRLNNSKGSEVSIPLVADRFDVTFEPSRDAIDPTQESGLVLLDGIDRVAPEVTPPDGLPVAASTDTRFLEDSVLTLKSPLDLTGLGRPTLTFRHWVDTGFHGTAMVEVTTENPVREASQDAADAGSGVQGGWKTVAWFNGTDTGRTTVPVSISLWDYAGQTVWLRFRYHIDPTVLTAEVAGELVPEITTDTLSAVINGKAIGRPAPPHDATPAGWLIEGVNVTAWGEHGPTTVHSASKGFPASEYAIKGGAALGGSLELSKKNCWSGYPPVLGSECDTYRGASSLMSGSFQIDNMDQPILTLVHAGDLWKTDCYPGIVSFPAVDIEYQPMADGLPGGPWAPGTPTEGYSYPASGRGPYLGWNRTEQAAFLPLLDLQGRLHGPPFAGTHALDAQNGCSTDGGEDAGLVRGYTFGTRSDVFNLYPLRAMEGGARVRLATWGEQGLFPGMVVAPSSFLYDDGDYDRDFYDVDSIQIAERLQIIDAEATSITSALDDRNRLLEFAPGEAQRVGTRMVMARDAATLVVKATNVGQADLEVDVSLRATSLADGTPIQITWMEDLGDSLRPHPNVETGHVTVPAGETVDVIFQASFLQAPPGSYRLTARVDATSGVDTNSANDIREQDVLVLPFRRIDLEPAEASVLPFAAEPTATRIIHATVANQGNVDEERVRLRADVVRMTGLTSFEPLVPPGSTGPDGLQPHALTPTAFKLERRGDGRFEASWTLGPQDLPQGVGPSDLFKSGQKYAVRIRADPAADSVKAWWPGAAGQPLKEATNATGLLNLTRAPDTDCTCLLIPFLVERLLYGTDFSPRNSTTVLPDLLPVNTTEQLMAGWTSTTTLDGTLLGPGERPDIPRWKFGTAAEAGDLFPGVPTGNTWLLPPYHGPEGIEQTLVSPHLPAHIVDGASRSILSMTYASDVAEGSAFLETRRLVGGQWTPWRPIDDTRAQRVAIVLAYDFPRVTPTGVGPLALDASDILLATSAQGSFGQLTANTPSPTVPLLEGGPGDICFADTDGDGILDPSEHAYMAAECRQVAIGDVRLTKGNPAGTTAGSQVQSGNTDVGVALTASGNAIGWVDQANDDRLGVGDRVYADLDGDGTASVGDLVLAAHTPDAALRGTVLTGSSTGLEEPLMEGAIRPAFIERNGNNAYGIGDTLVLYDPDLTVEAAYDREALRNAGHPAPSWINDPPAGGNDQVPTCNDPVNPSSLCLWGAPMRFDLAGNEVWADALDTALRQLSNSLQADNVALFSTVGSPSTTQLALGHWENGTLVHTVRDGAATLRFPIRDLDALGADLDRYGAILLVGDGTTKAFAKDSAALRTMAHGPGDTATPDFLPPAERALAELHHKKLFAILGAAAPAGVRLVGSLGPAAATLALSNVVPGASLAVWQTFPFMPTDDLYRTGGLYCTGVKAGIAAWQTSSYTMAAPGTPHPLNPCRKNINNVATPDPTDPHNYRLVSPQDQQSIFLRNAVETNGDVALAGTNLVHLPQGASYNCGGQNPQHALIAASLFALCNHFRGTESDQVGSLAVLTAARPEDVGEWVRQVTEELASTTGALPSGEWQPLPPSLAFPFGGRFLRRSNGSDEFDGSPTQFRIRIVADGVAEGHGAFAVDRIGLLGTNRAFGLGIAFVAPLDGRAYTPGRAFDVVVQATNRGVATTPATQAVVTMERWKLDACSVSQWEPVTVDVPELAAGEQKTLVPGSKLNQGFFPNGPTCPAPALQNSRYNLTVRLPDAWDDGEPRDDLQAIQVLGRQVVSLDASAVPEKEVKASPARATYQPDMPIEVSATVRNFATSVETFSLQVVLEHARPLTCMRKDTPQWPLDQNLYGCSPADTIAVPIALPRKGIVSKEVDGGGSATLRLSTTPEQLGIGAGLYRISVRVSVTDTAKDTLTYPPLDQLPIQRLLRLTPSTNVTEAQALLPPDGAFGFQSDSLDDLQESQMLATRPLTGVWDPSGFLVTNEGSFANASVMANDGTYGPDPTTVDRTSPDGPRLIQHGWRVGCAPDAMVCPTDSTRSYLEWRREGTPSYRDGTDLRKWPQSDTADPNAAQTPDDLGYGDFGPDTVSWLPQNPADRNTDPSRTPFLSLASFEAPVLSFLTRYDGTPNTAFVIEMEVPARVNCVPLAGASGSNCKDSGWNWNEPPVVPRFVLTTVGMSNPLPVTKQMEAGAGVDKGSGLAPDTPTWIKNRPSNPLAGTTGFWGQASGQHVEDGGWVRIHIPLTEAAQPGITEYCRLVATAGDSPSPGAREYLLPSARNPCAYAQASDRDTDSHANAPETYVARPVRFRFRAASYGGDVGESVWQIADLGVTDGRIRFLGPSQVSVSMRDEDTRIVPVRIRNEGRIPDQLEVAWAPTRGHSPTLGRNGSIALSTMPDMRNAAERLVLDLAPGQSRVVWVRIHTGILDSVNPESTQHIPFLVQARSLLDTTLVEELLVDAQFTTRAWPDLVATKLVLGDNEAQGMLFNGSLGSPLKATLSFRNVGELAIGSPSQPIRITLIAEELDDNGTVIDGTRQVVDEQFVTTPVLPSRQDRNEHFVSFAEWLPPRLGLFQLSAELNAGAGAGLPESDRSNNVRGRIVAVGPVRFADLHVADLWAVEFHGTCGEVRVQRLIAGHIYCLAARVENHGLRSVLEPRIDFGVGASAPFSAGAPPLAESLPGRVFPAADGEQVPSRVVHSSPRAIVAPPASSSGYVFYGEVSSRSIMPNFAGKNLKLALPVDVYQFAAALDAQAVSLSPGREVRIPLTLGNRGNVPATAGVTLSSDTPGLEVRLDGARTLLRGENATVTLTLVAGRDLDTAATIGDLKLTIAEDPRAAIPLNLRVNVADGGLPDAQTLSLRTAPGLTNATLVLDAASSPVPYRWRAEAVTGPLRVPTGWNATTQPFGREVVTLPLTVAAAAPPGLLHAPLRLVAEHDGVQVMVPFNVTLDVAPRPGLSARLVPDHRTAAPGAQAAFALQLNNTGNVALSPHVAHHVDLGAVTPEDQAAMLPPGQGVLLPFTALAGPFPRALGQTEVSWSTAGGRSGNVTLPWRLDVQEARFEIAGGLPDLRPVAGKTSQVQVPVLNAGTAPAEAEVLLALDGVLQSRRTVTLDPGEVRQVALPFKAGASGATQDLEVLVRPVGSDAWLGDAALYDAGDVGNAKVEPVGGSSWPVPALDALLALMACLAVAAARRRRA